MLSSVDLDCDVCRCLVGDPNLSFSARMFHGKCVDVWLGIQTCLLVHACFMGSLSMFGWGNWGVQPCLLVHFCFHMPYGGMQPKARRTMAPMPGWCRCVNVLPDVSLTDCTEMCTCHVQTSTKIANTTNGNTLPSYAPAGAHATPRPHYSTIHQ